MVKVSHYRSATRRAALTKLAQAVDPAQAAEEQAKANAAAASWSNGLARSYRQNPGAWDRISGDILSAYNANAPRGKAVSQGHVANAMGQFAKAPPQTHAGVTNAVANLAYNLGEDGDARSAGHFYGGAREYMEAIDKGFYKHPQDYHFAMTNGILPQVREIARERARAAAAASGEPYDEPTTFNILPDGAVGAALRPVMSVAGIDPNMPLDDSKAVDWLDSVAGSMHGDYAAARRRAAANAMSYLVPSLYDRANPPAPPVYGAQTASR